MSGKKLVIQNCGECPHKDHKGAFAKISRVPVCRKTDKELPYAISIGPSGNLSAIPTNVIPANCTLLDNEA